MIVNLEFQIDENNNKLTYTHLVSEKGYFTRNGENVGYHLVLSPGVGMDGIEEVKDRTVFHSLDGPITYITE